MTNQLSSSFDDSKHNGKPCLAKNDSPYAVKVLCRRYGLDPSTARWNAFEAFGIDGGWHE